MEVCWCSSSATSVLTVRFSLYTFDRDTRCKLKEAIGAGQAAGKVMREQYDAVTRELARTQAEFGTCKQQQARLEESYQQSADVLQQEVRGVSNQFL